MSVAERGTRIGLNEALFREVNERVKGINVGFSDDGDEAEFICECGDESCTERVVMTLTDYERVRAEPRRFAVRPGHEVHELEEVVERTGTYLVVQKRLGEPARIAEETNPRS
jgi:hypothetical protein